MLNRTRTVAGAVLLAAGAAVVVAQDDGSSAVWHNRYHALLAQATYSGDMQQCSETFTEATMRQNFPDTNLRPYEILEHVGPTEHSCEAWTLQIPEMDKVVTVFRGNYGVEMSLPNNLETTNLNDALGLGTCENCTANAYAMRGYLECREQSNNWAIGRARVEQTGLQYSLAGHGLGGMHSIIASLDLGWAGVVAWSHSHGAPRTLNPAGAALYSRLFQGEAGERGVANSDGFVELIPQSDDYVHAGTAFYYSGHSNVTHMNMRVCRDDSESPDCAPPTPYSELDHYFYFDNVGRCGQGRWREDRQRNAGFLSSYSSAFQATATALASMPNATSSALNTTSAPASTEASSSTALPSGESTTAPPSASAGIAGQANAAQTTPADTGSAGRVKVASAAFAGAALLLAALSL